MEKMPEIQLGAHTVKSHGVKVAKSHMHDWIILVFLGVVEIILNVIEPFHRFVGSDMMDDLKYPLKSNTVPFWAVPMIGIVLPFAIFIGFYFYRRDVYDLHHAILGSYDICEPGLLYSTLITGVITDAIKDAVGRPRPDFFWRCFPDGKPKFDPVTTDVICHGVKSVIKEGHKSWGPHAYFQMLADSRNGVQSAATTNCLNVQSADMENVYMPSGHGTGSYGVGMRESSPILDDALEAGRRHY
ncbi:hypothetical protein ACLOJK_033100 [Asimina triloba]